MYSHNVMLQTEKKSAILTVFFFTLNKKCEAYFSKHNRFYIYKLQLILFFSSNRAGKIQRRACAEIDFSRATDVRNAIHGTSVAGGCIRH